MRKEKRWRTDWEQRTDLAALELTHLFHHGRSKFSCCFQVFIHLFLNIFFLYYCIFFIHCAHCTHSSKTETFYRSELHLGSQREKMHHKLWIHPYGASWFPCCLQPSASLRGSEVSLTSCSALLKLELTHRSVPVHTTRRAGRPPRRPSLAWPLQEEHELLTERCLSKLKKKVRERKRKSQTGRASPASKLVQPYSPRGEPP